MCEDNNPHDVYSVLVRKRGRLEDLENKNYIEEIEDRFTLTDKGIYAILILKPEIANQMNKKFYNTLVQDTNKLLDMTNHIQAPFMNIEIKGIAEAAKKLHQTIKVLEPEDWLMQANLLRKLIKEGIDLDAISPFDLRYLVLLNRIKETDLDALFI